MRSQFISVALLLLSSTTPSWAAPQPVSGVSLRQDAAISIKSRDLEDLWKRKGGGGGGGKGGGGGSTSSSGSSSSSGKGGSSSGGTGSSSSGSGRGSSSSAAGGSTRQGSGVQPSHAGSKGSYYGGGAKAPYTSGGRSPAGIAPVFLGVAALSIFPGLWLYGAYNYPYNHPYSYRNRTGRRNSTASSNTPPTRRDRIYSELVHLITRQDDGANETKPVDCLCAAYAVCGCDDNDDTSFLDSLIGDGSYDGLNKSVINVVDVNGTSTIVLNGTLANGTTAAGGTEDVNGASDTSSTSDTTGTSGTSGSSGTSGTSGSSGSVIVQASGYWVVAAIVVCSVYLM